MSDVTLRAVEPHTFPDVTHDVLYIFCLRQHFFFSLTFVVGVCVHVMMETRLQQANYFMPWITETLSGLFY